MNIADRSIQARLEEVVDYLEKMACGDLSLRIPVSNERDYVDAVSYGINILTEEVQYKQAQEEKRRYDLEQTQVKLTKALNDLQLTQEQLIQSAKLAVLGEICAGIAHEVNNPLATISGYLDTLDSRSEKEQSLSVEDLRPYLKKMHKQINRIVDIVSHVRNFSKRSTQEYEVIDLRDTINGSLMLFEQSFLEQRIEAVKEIPQKPVYVFGDPTHLEQVVVNVLANAKDAISAKSNEGGRIKVILTEKDRNACVTIADNGVGLDPATRDQIFDPFFTTKNPGSGTGLGLSISKGIINSHHGRIKIEACKEYSTVVTIEIPLH